MKVTNRLNPYSHLNSQYTKHRLISQLEREVEILQAEKRELEAFIDRTDSWLEHVGRWRVTVSQNSNIEEGGKTIPYFVLLVHLESKEETGDADGAEVVEIAGAADGKVDGCNAASTSFPSTSFPSKYSDTHGFVVTRRLSDFHLLHKKLQPLGPHLAENRLFKLPSPGIFDKDTSEKFLEKAMAKLQVVSRFGRRFRGFFTVLGTVFALFQIGLHGINVSSQRTLFFYFLSTTELKFRRGL